MAVKASSRPGCRRRNDLGAALRIEEYGVEQRPVRGALAVSRQQTRGAAVPPGKE
jgi:hypothetical protein